MNTHIELVEQGVAQFADGLRAEVADEHPHVQAAMDGYLDILQCGGKRTRGALALCGYELFGGEKDEIITATAGAVEGLHAYLLVIDDVADHALTRRGKPAAHIAIQSFLEQQGAENDTRQTAEDLAIAAALVAQHHAQSVFSELDVAPERRLKTLQNVNRHLAKTSVGQILDIASTTGVQMTTADITTVAQYKTAHYSFQLPLETGALLAGAQQRELIPLARYSHHAGRAFQLQDDILGVFGDEEIMGKSPMSDLKEGKQTLLVSHALAHADPDQASFLRGSLGRDDLTEDDFETCRRILMDTGALAKVEELAAQASEHALAVLTDCPDSWPSEKIALLRSMASFAVNRSA